MCIFFNEFGYLIIFKFRTWNINARINNSDISSPTPPRNDWVTWQCLDWMIICLLFEFTGLLFPCLHLSPPPYIKKNEMYGRISKTERNSSKGENKITLHNSEVGVWAMIAGKEFCFQHTIWMKHIFNELKVVSWKFFRRIHLISKFKR